jgi:hypothetical protein
VQEVRLLSCLLINAFLQWWPIALHSISLFVYYIHCSGFAFCCLWTSTWPGAHLHFCCCGCLLMCQPVY